MASPEVGHQFVPDTQQFCKVGQNVNVSYNGLLSIPEVSWIEYKLIVKVWGACEWYIWSYKSVKL